MHFDTLPYHTHQKGGKIFVKYTKLNEQINMQVANADPHLTVTFRHESITDALRDFVQKKVATLHLDYPRIIEVKAILDVQKHKNRHIAEIILYCANHITIEASSETDDMYKSIDETVSKIARRMRKQKTRLLKKQRAPKNKDANSIRYIDEKIFDELALDHPEESSIDPEPVLIHRENYRLKTMLKEDALMELELSDRPFLLFRNERRNCLQIVYRKENGDYGLVPVPEN